MFNKYPYTDFHELNLDWFLQQFKTNSETIIATVQEWLDEHPEATTTVEDGSLTIEKFTEALKLATENNYVTPAMFGAVGDGTTDDSEAVITALTYPLVDLDGLTYNVSNIYVPSGQSCIIRNGSLIGNVDSNNQLNSIIRCSNFGHLTFENVNFYGIDNITAMTTAEVKSGLYFSNGESLQFNKCGFYDFYCNNISIPTNIADRECCTLQINDVDYTIIDECEFHNITPNTAENIFILPVSKSRSEINCIIQNSKFIDVAMTAYDFIGNDLKCINNVYELTDLSGTSAFNAFALNFISENERLSADGSAGNIFDNCESSYFRGDTVTIQNFITDVITHNSYNDAPFTQVQADKVSIINCDCGTVDILLKSNYDYPANPTHRDENTQAKTSPLHAVIENCIFDYANCIVYDQAGYSLYSDFIISDCSCDGSDGNSAISGNTSSMLDVHDSLLKYGANGLIYRTNHISQINIHHNKLYPTSQYGYIFNGVSVDNAIIVGNVLSSSISDPLVTSLTNPTNIIASNNKGYPTVSYKLSWTASSSSATNSLLTDSVTIPAGTYKVRFKLPISSVAIPLSIKLGSSNIIFISLLASTYQDFETTIQIDNAGTVGLYTAGSASATYTNTADAQITLTRV